MVRIDAWLVLIAVLCGHVTAAGQDLASSASSPEMPSQFDGPPPPVPPAVLSRDASGRATVRAVRLSAPLDLDGRLDESVYASVPSMSDFIQTEPTEGLPATEKTEVWLFFDEDNVYVAARCWETQPERMVAFEMRRDNPSTWNGNDVVSFLFDTFYDRRNGIGLTVNPVGGRNDGQIVNGVYHADWNPIFNVKVGSFEGGWTVEVALPFKSLRYRPGRAQVWGFNALRANRWKNELSLLTRIPAGRGMFSVHQAQLAASVMGLEAPPPSRNLEIKPYVTSDLQSDSNVLPRIVNDLGGEIGVDAKYGITQNLTADFTVNTDFAQVEADEQQINLTRFSLLFPEKRDFFLENQGTFAFGGISVTGQAAAGGDAPILFYSRRIGLDQGLIVPLEAGGRLTGRVGRYTIGAINIQTGDDEAVPRAEPTNFSVVRVKRDVLRRSAVGLLFTGRSKSQTAPGASTAYGADGTFAFYDNLFINGYWARTDTPLAGDDTASYRAFLDYTGDRYGVQMERLAVGDNFNPEAGFVRRDDMRRNFGLFRFSPRPSGIPSVRRFSWLGSLTYIEDGDGRLESRESEGEFAIEFKNNDRLSVGYSSVYEFLPEPFPISPGVILPVGGYSFDVGRITFNMGQQRKASAIITAEHGTFYNGHKTTVSATRGRVTVKQQLSVEPTYSVNWVDLQEGAFTTHLAGARVTYTMTPQMFTSALLQYNSTAHVVSANVRLRWEYRPGSELFIVYNEQRDTFGERFPDLATRALILKINRLFKF